MKKTEFWYWRMRSDTTGKVGKCSCRYREEDALARDPGAVRIDGTCEVRDCPETTDENYSIAPARGQSTSGTG